MTKQKIKNCAGGKHWLCRQAWHLPPAGGHLGGAHLLCQVPRGEGSLPTTFRLQSVITLILGSIQVGHSTWRIFVCGGGREGGDQGPAEIIHQQPQRQIWALLSAPCDTAAPSQNTDFFLWCQNLILWSDSRPIMANAVFLSTRSHSILIMIFIDL